MDRLKVNEGWQERFKVLGSRPVAQVQVELVDEVSALLTSGERVVIAQLLAVVGRTAERLVLGMLKGMIKYAQQERPVDEWLELLEDEVVDTCNYVALLGAARRVERCREGAYGSTCGSVRPT